ncbi:MAG TPA: amidohydrolase family protein [Caulobacteraceae bacterium]|jgi:imidazolonepropionase-like amidohydrolase
MLRSLVIGALAATLALPVAAETIAITNARILTMGPAGEIGHGTVVVRDGKVAEVGAILTPPAGARVIDAHGGVVTPGLVAVGAPISVSEVSEGVPETDDSSTASDRLSAAFDPQYAVNPWSLVIPTARLGGVTDVVLTPEFRQSHATRPSSMIFAGQATAIHLGPGVDLLAKPHAGMVLILGEEGAERVGGSRAAEFVLLRSILQDVRDYEKNKAQYDLGHSRELGLGREDLEALIPVVEGREPLIASVHRAADILQTLRLAQDEKLNLILEGAEEGYMVAPQIAAARVPVLVHGFEDLPSSFDRIGATLENPGRLQAAGVTVVIENPSFFTSARTPRIDAGRAVAHGLPYAAALASITITPAKVFGLADHIGSIEPGKDADIVVWSGDPLEPLSAPTAVLVKGVDEPLRDRDLDLRDRYMPGAPPVSAQ